jgi:transcriptional regulator with XRE-family HTH domain
MTEHKINIGHKIKSLRELKGYSQDYVATKLHISQNALSKIERGEIKISLDKASELAEVMEIELDSLINFEPGNYFNQCNQFGVINTTFQTDKKLLEDLLNSKDVIISEKDARIKLLEMFLNMGK